MNADDTLAQQFVDCFGGTPDLITRAPGRVNLIGEHTDYNEGFVLPMAINYDVRAAARARVDRIIRLYSVDFHQFDTFSLDDIHHASRSRGWSNYVRGVADVLQREGHNIHGLDAAISGEVPRGAGLSSSAALELATLIAFKQLDNLDIDPLRAALLCQRAENEFVGVRCGVMDQMIASLGRANNALLIDCRSLKYTAVPLPHKTSIVVVDSGVRRGLVESAYNDRRSQCEEGARQMGVPTLRDVTLDMFASWQNKLPAIVARRCLHVVTENQRVLDSAAALRSGDLAAFGALMNASHASMRDLFEVSTPEIDTLVEIQQDVPGCLGARLTGGGFGGCTVALVYSEAVSALQERIIGEYAARTGKATRIYICYATDGAGIV